MNEEPLPQSQILLRAYVNIYSINIYLNNETLVEPLEFPFVPIPVIANGLIDIIGFALVGDGTFSKGMTYREAMHFGGIYAGQV
jgi:hypothetical protein